VWSVRGRGSNSTYQKVHSATTGPGLPTQGRASHSGASSRARARRPRPRASPGPEPPYAASAAAAIPGRSSRGVNLKRVPPAPHPGDGPASLWPTSQRTAAVSGPVSSRLRSRCATTCWSGHHHSSGPSACVADRTSMPHRPARRCTGTANTGRGESTSRWTCFCSPKHGPNDGQTTSGGRYDTYYKANGTSSDADIHIRAPTTPLTINSKVKLIPGENIYLRGRPLAPTGQRLDRTDPHETTRSIPVPRRPVP